MDTVVAPGEPVPLSSLFEPSSVAVMGASAKEGSFGRRLIENLVGGGYSGELFPISRSSPEVEGRLCYGSLSDLPHPAECVVVAVPSHAVVSAVEEASSSGSRVVMVLSSGFAELGGGGESEQRRLAEITRDRGVALVGPNCMGVVNFWGRTALTFLPGIARMCQTMAREPGLAVVSQSGALGSYLIQAYLRGVTFSYLFSAGNSPLVDVGDALFDLAAKPEVTAFCLAFEGLRPGTALLRGLDAAAEEGKPVVAVKAGSSHAGAAAAVTHTASRVGDDIACRAALTSRGVLLVDGHDKLVEAANFLGKTVRGPRRSDGVLVVTGSGGAGVIACDAMERHGVRLATLSTATKERLGEVLPPFAQPANPLDITAALSSQGGLQAVLDVSASDPDVGTLVVLLGVSLHGETGAERAGDTAATADAQNMPAAVVWMGEDFSGHGVEELERAPRVGLFRSIDLCVRTLAHADLLRSRAVAGGTVDPKNIVEVDWSAVEGALGASASGPGGLLDEPSSLAVLEALGLPVVGGRRVEGPDFDVALEAVAGEWDAYPAVVKVVSSSIAHKSTAGGVELGVRDAAALVAAGHRILERVGLVGAGPIEGLVVQPQLSGSRELLLGAYRDPVYGAVVVVGQGGQGGVDGCRAVEALAVPVTVDDACRALSRSALTADLVPEIAGHLVNAMVRLGALMVGRNEVLEVDVNPLVVDGAARRATAVDGLVRLATVG